MKKFNEIAVFEGSVSGLSFPSYLYLNEGFMRDFERLTEHLSTLDHVKGLEHETPKKNRLLYHGELPIAGAKLYCIVKNDGSHTSWFVSEEVAREANGLAEKDYKEVLIAQFVPHKVEPLPATFEVELKKGKNDGEFMCYVNLHPEVNGNACKRKIICFPDKSWVGPIKEGPARVSVVREMESYAFLSGEMISV